MELCWYRAEFIGSKFIITSMLTPMPICASEVDPFKLEFSVQRKAKLSPMFGQKSQESSRDARQ